MNNSLVKPEFALMSVSDKEWLAELGRAFNTRGIDIISTGGTFLKLQEGEVKVQEVSAYSWQPEILDGRLKTLTPHVHGWLLADLDIDKHVAEIAEQSIRKIDVLVANLYPFEINYERFKKGEITKAQLIEQIDIGGPWMLRSGAKNFKHTAVITDPMDYSKLLRNLDENDGHTSLEFREYLAWKVFNRTTEYDAAIADFFNANK